MTHAQPRLRAAVARLRAAHASVWWLLGVTALLVAVAVLASPFAAELLLVADVFLFGCAGLLPAGSATGTAVTPEEAWDNGCQHGLRIALTTVQRTQAPYVTMSEERGWHMAHRQLTAVLAQLVTDADDDTAPVPA